MNDRKKNLAEFIRCRLESGETECVACGKRVTEETADAFGGYWHGTQFLVHKDCKKSAARFHTQYCRFIDQNCNDCKHFRGIRFTEGDRHSRKRIGVCGAGVVDGEFGVYPGDPMNNMECFELRGCEIFPDH